MQRHILWIVFLVLSAQQGCGNNAANSDGTHLLEGKFVRDSTESGKDYGPPGADFWGPQDAVSDGTRIPLDVGSLPDEPYGSDTKEVKPDEIVEPPCSPGESCCVPGTQCYKKAWQIMGSKLSIIVDDQAYNPTWYLLGVLPPDTKTVSVRLRSTGVNQLNLVDAFLEPGGNPFVTLEWVTPGMPEDMPLVLMPGEEVEGKIVYVPKGDPPPTPAVLTVWSSDPAGLSRSVVFKPKESGPDIELPYSVASWGCNNWCFGQDFLIENAGNKPLIIESTSFEKPNPNWSAQGVPSPGTSLQPAGSPGYAPLTFTLTFCDESGDYTDDSNKFLIYSNDPDENPACIYLNVQLPELCPNL